MQSFVGISRIGSSDLLSKRKLPKCFNQGSDITILLKGHSRSRLRRDMDPGKVQEQDDML